MDAPEEELALLQPACFRCGCSGALSFLQVAALPCARALPTFSVLEPPLLN